MKIKIKEKLYKLNCSIYCDEDEHTLSNESMYDYKGKLIDPLYARKGKLYKRIEVTKDNYDKLSEEYFITKDCKYIYTDGKSYTKDIYVSDEDCNWFSEVIK